MWSLVELIVVVFGLTVPTEQPVQPVDLEFAAPVKILAKGDPIDVTVGHAAPYVVDWNQDGKKDLVVGQFGGGQCRIYLNTGTNSAPEFQDFTWLIAGGSEAKVPSG
jgi:hypothetical protein